MLILSRYKGKAFLYSIFKVQSDMLGIYICNTTFNKQRIVAVCHCICSLHQELGLDDNMILFHIIILVKSRIKTSCT